MCPLILLVIISEKLASLCRNYIQAISTALLPASMFFLAAENGTHRTRNSVFCKGCALKNTDFRVATSEDILERTIFRLVYMTSNRNKNVLLTHSILRSTTRVCVSDSAVNW